MDTNGKVLAECGKYQLSFAINIGKKHNKKKWNKNIFEQSPRRQNSAESVSVEII